MLDPAGRLLRSEERQALPRPRRLPWGDQSTPRSMSALEGSPLRFGPEPHKTASAEKNSEAPGLSHETGTFRKEGHQVLRAVSSLRWREIRGLPSGRMRHFAGFLSNSGLALGLQGPSHPFLPLKKFRFSA